LCVLRAHLPIPPPGHSKHFNIDFHIVGTTECLVLSEISPGSHSSERGGRFAPIPKVVDYNDPRQHRFSSIAASMVKPIQNNRYRNTSIFGASWPNSHSMRAHERDLSKQISTWRQLALAEFVILFRPPRDGHGFVQRNETANPTFTCHPTRCAASHNDRVKARIVRHRKNSPEGRATEIVERSPNPIIGRLLVKAFTAPEDVRYGSGMLIPAVPPATWW
jgi:hypothetical protein